MNLFTKAAGRKSVIITWLISYITVLLIPILISGIVYLSAINEVRRNTVETNSIILKKIQRDIDNSIKDIETIHTQLIFNKYVRLISSMDKIEVNSVRFEIFEFSKQISTYKLALKDVAEIFVYFNKNDTLVHPNVTSDAKSFLHAYNLDEYLSEDQWNDLVSSYSAGSYYKLSSKTGKAKSEVLYVKSLTSKGQGDETTNLVVRFDEKIFLNTIKEVNYLNQQDSAFMIRDNEKVLFSTNNKISDDALELLQLKFKSNLTSHKIGGKRVVLTGIESEIIPWTYLCIIPEYIFWNKMGIIRNILIFGSIFSLVVGVYISYILAKKNYNPLKKVVELFDRNAQNNKVGNEFYYIEKSLLSVFNEKEKAVYSLKSQSSIVRTSILQKLLNGKYDILSSENDLLEQLNIVFYSDSFAVLLFSIDDYEKLFEDEKDLESADRYELSQFILTNVFQELASQNNVGYVFETDNMMSCIINFKTEDLAENKKDIKRIVDEFTTFVKDNFNIHFSIAASNIHHSSQAIFVAFNEAIETMEYKILMGIDEFLEYSDFKTANEMEYTYSLDKEIKLINYIKSGNYESSKNILEEVFANTFKRGNVSLQEIKCLTFDMVSTMIKTADEIVKGSDNTTIKEIVTIDKLLQCASVNELKNEMLNILQLLCNHISETYTSSDIIDKTKEYIMQNYLNSELNVSSIGNHFNLTSSYISKMFKEQVGKSILDYINDIRMEKARQLILNSDDNIENIALSCGYISIHTFLRIFKKYFGVTPGQFKKNNN